MRSVLSISLVAGCLGLAGCQTQPYASGHAEADALMAELQAEATASGTAARAITFAGSMDPSGVGAGAAHAINKSMLRAHNEQVNARLRNRIMAQDMAIMKCIEESQALSGGTPEDHAIACARRIQGQP